MKFRENLRLILMLVTLAALIGASALVHGAARPVEAASPPQTGNLLTNPGFEEPTDKSIAEGWTAWWYDDPGPIYMLPEFSLAPAEGGMAQRVSRSDALWQGGIYQRVQAPAGSTLQFSVWGRASSAGGENPIYLKVGIDPAGGTDPSAPSVVWSFPRSAADRFEMFSVQARAHSQTVTVFTWSTNQHAAAISTAVWDDASLTATVP